MLEQTVLMQGTNFPEGCEVKTQLGKKVTPFFNQLLLDADKYTQVSPETVSSLVNMVIGWDKVDMVEFTCRFEDGSEIKTSRVFTDDAPEMPFLETLMTRPSFKSEYKQAASYCRIDTLALHNATKNQIAQKTPNVMATVGFANYVFSKGKDLSSTHFFSNLVKVAEGESFVPLIVKKLADFATDMAFSFGMGEVKGNFNFYAKGLPMDKAMQKCVSLLGYSLVSTISQQINLSIKAVKSAQIVCNANLETSHFGAHTKTSVYGFHYENVYALILGGKLFLFVGYDSEEDLADDKNVDPTDIKTITLIYQTLP